MTANREIFDGVLLGLAEKHTGGVPDLLTTIAEFLARKTDFFTGAGEEAWKKMLMDIFEPVGKKSLEAHKEKMLKKAQAELKRKEEQEKKKPKLDADQSGVTELTEEEANALQKELDAKKNATETPAPQPAKKKSEAVKPESGEELSKPIEKTGDEEDDKEVGKLMPNKGNGANMEKYSWTQTLQEVENTENIANESEPKIEESDGEPQNGEKNHDDEENDDDGNESIDANETVIMVVEADDDLENDDEKDDELNTTEPNTEVDHQEDTKKDEDITVKAVPNRPTIKRPNILVTQRRDQLRAFMPKPKVHLKQPKFQTYHIYPGCYQLPYLIEQMYNEMEKQFEVFATYVSQSTFAYYCAVVVYHRILDLRWQNGEKLTKDEIRLQKQVRALKLPVPSLLQLYIAGMGNVFIHNGHCYEKYIFKTHSIEYTSSNDRSMGWFGRIGPKTHFLYQKYPCLSVFAKRIIEDMRCDAEDVDKKWNLPEDIAPENENAGFPTDNLLGYSPARPMLNSQKAFLAKRCGVTEKKFPTSNDTFCLSLTLLKEVKKELHGEKSLSLFSSKIRHAKGSLAQLPYHVVYAVSPDNLSSSSVESDGPFRQYSKYRIPNPLHVAGMRFQYQLLCKINEKSPNKWCVYDFNAFQEVPEEWRDTMASEVNSKIDTKSNYFTKIEDWADLIDFTFEINGQNFIKMSEQ